jgi:hypothetical protein
MRGERNRVRSAGYTVCRPIGAAAKLPGVVRHPQAIGALVRRSFLALLPLLLAASADAQIIRGGLRLQEPAAWASLGVGLQSSFAVVDGTTGSGWEFGDGLQYVAGLEKTVSSGIMVGVRGTHARLPLRYSSATTFTEADANVSQIVALVHVASGREFHSVLELSAGATLFSNFRSRSTDQRLEPMGVDADFAFGFGYGFGYNFTPRFAIDAVQEISTSLHQKTGLTAGESSSVRINSTRIVARFGLGGR